LTLVTTEVDGVVSGFLDAPVALGYPVLEAATGRGPALTGTAEGDKLFLASEVFTGTGGTTRQVALHTSVFSDTEQLLTGVYTETVWGLSPDPVQIVGEFTLMRHSYQLPMQPWIYLPIIFRH